MLTILKSLVARKAVITATSCENCDHTLIAMSTFSFPVIDHRRNNAVIVFEENSRMVKHYSDVIMSTIASQITGVSIVCSTICSGTDQRKHQSSSSLAIVRVIHRWSVDSPHKKASNPENISIWWRHHDSAENDLYGISLIRKGTKWSPFCRRHFLMNGNLTESSHTRSIW